MSDDAENTSQIRINILQEDHNRKLGQLSFVDSRHPKEDTEEKMGSREVGVVWLAV